MSNSFEASADGRVLRLAAGLAALAAVFMVMIWAPLQIRAFDRAIATQNTPSGSLATDWQHLQLVTSGGHLTTVADLKGRVRIVTMMYAHCPGVCPLALSTLRDIERQLPPRYKDQLSIVAIGLNPDEDTDSLSLAAKPFMASGSHWTVGIPSREGVTGFARALGVRYQDIGDGSIDHQSVFVLLNRKGEVVGRTEQTQQIDRAFVAALTSALN